MEKMLGVMLDCSRNAVMNVDTIKKYASLIKKMGYNTLMLYTEDTYEVNNQPFIGYMRGRYTKDEIKEIDAYCCDIGIELIPCIQTLAHLEGMLRWRDVYEEIRDCDNILLANHEKTYQLISDMFSTISECFSTNKIHIGMDEAYMVGLGKYRTLYGDMDRFDIINNHLHKVCEIAEKYNFECMIWSDMFCKLALNIESQYETADLSQLKEKAALPDNVSLVYWDYYSTDYERYANNIKTNKAFGKKVYFAGGAWTWKGFIPDNDFSIKTTQPAVTACNDYDVDGMFITLWGDDGNECSKFSVLPTLMYMAELSRGNSDIESIKKKFEEIVHCDFDSFLLMDKLDTPGGKHTESPNRYILYNDLFMGLSDWRCSEKDEEYYTNLANELGEVEKSEYRYLFDTAKKLAEVLALKVNLGNITRSAYLKNDISELKKLADKYDVLIKKIEDFHGTFEEQWMKEYKPHGFDVQDLRIGGLIQRIKSLKNRLNKYITGEIKNIPELEEERLEAECLPRWSHYVSANIVSHSV